MNFVARAVRVPFFQRRTRRGVRRCAEAQQGRRGVSGAEKMVLSPLVVEVS